ncbi:uncharacterized protein LOC127858264 isoform X2 [Dreissena polymorpha]|uniref:uncharacterized protein LOC127858264 isoform X2 n=1 Tax=Dreissena polymorpha TaxID=45954 RepID=UPI0022651C10|nr:uncharacterized protein LOC127858264 isoform X2 [Dreissena polymorpha]
MESLKQNISAEFGVIGTDNVTVASTIDKINKLNLEEVVRLIPLIIFLLLIVLAGIPGNGLVCFIYRNEYFMSSSRWFIFFLAAVDLLMCILIIPSEIATTFFQYNFTSTASCKITAFFNLWSLLSLGLTLLAVSVDRYRKVCKPLGWQINFNKARILSVACVGLSLLISLPVLLLYNIHEKPFKAFNITGNECSFRTDGGMSWTFLFVMFGMTLFVTALTSICILYCFIGKEIKRHIDKERIKRHISMTASMAFNTNLLIRPITQEITVKCTKKSVGFATSVSMKPKKSVNFGVLNVEQALQKEKHGHVNGIRSDRTIHDVVRKTRIKESAENTKHENDRRKNLPGATESDCKSFNMACESEYRPLKNSKETDANKWNDNHTDRDSSHLDDSCLQACPCEKQHVSCDLAVNPDNKDTLTLSSVPTSEINSMEASNFMTSKCAETDAINSNETPIHSGDQQLQEKRESMLSLKVTSLSPEDVSTEYEESSSNANYADEESMDDLNLPPKRTMTIKERNKSKRIRRARAKKATLSMIMISVAFVLSYLPFFCLLIMKSLQPELEEWMTDAGRATFKFFLRSFFFNCAINPFIYGISDSKFRKSCKEVIDKVFGRKNLMLVTNANS